VIFIIKDLDHQTYPPTFSRIFLSSAGQQVISDQRFSLIFFAEEGLRVAFS